MYVSNGEKGERAKDTRNRNCTVQPCPPKGKIIMHQCIQCIQYTRCTVYTIYTMYTIHATYTMYTMYKPIGTVASNVNRISYMRAWVFVWVCVCVWVSVHVYI